QWNDAYNQYNIDLMENASLEKFQIILYPRPGQDGDIVIQYHTVDNPGTTTNYCTVGIEDETQLIGLQYTHGNTYPATAAILQPGLAIRFTTTPPDNYLANDEPLLSVPFALEQNYPNPFNPSTTISFTAKGPGCARLAIYNLKGQLVRNLLNADVAAGKHSLTWDGRDEHGNAAASGIYLYKLELNGATCSKKMLMLK
ncbi:MAG TPA: FlgD immunoglobulin-like domain containing protein, partial [Candidatus Cloacimonadota bacterium]|nr:FlgD immunoglobulin-like domain containing protein [Candidatus Cloacimonadota bacterium]